MGERGIADRDEANSVRGSCSHDADLEGDVRVAKWGNSLAVRLPKQLVEALFSKAGDELEIVDASRQRLALA